MENTNQEYGICDLSLVPLRAQPSDKSEMTSQLLFGDHFQVLEKTEKWARIMLSYDDYEGWIDRKQFKPVDMDLVGTEAHCLGLGLAHPVLRVSDGEMLHLLPGSSLPEYNNGKFRIQNENYRVNGALVGTLGEFKEDIRTVARFFQNAPYLWGGRSLFGIDCSGYTQIVFKMLGVRLKRDAWQQAEQGELVSFLPEAKTGDLAFFDNEEGRIVHVGIMLDNSTIIHASGKVRVDAIDDQGIFNSELKRYTHKLRIIKRFNV